MSEEITTNEGVTRREALKKGARLGGALVWAVPVVQTVGMSSAMAAPLSEGRCCLRISLTDPVAVGNGVVEFTWSVMNCGTLEIDNARGIIEVSRDGGTNWQQPPIVSDNKGLLASGASDSTDDDISLAPGTYLFRMHGEFDCDGITAIWHSVPGNGVDSYIEKGPVVVT